MDEATYLYILLFLLRPIAITIAITITISSVVIPITLLLLYASGEHMPDKGRYVQEMARVLKPGGRLVIATWCQRDEGGRPFNVKEKKVGYLILVATSYSLREMTCSYVLCLFIDAELPVQRVDAPLFHQHLRLCQAHVQHRKVGLID